MDFSLKICFFAAYIPDINWKELIGIGIGNRSETEAEGEGDETAEERQQLVSYPQLPLSRQFNFKP